MRKTAIIFFLTSALIFILGHSVFPHSHSKSAFCAHCISEKKNLSLTDIIRNTLSRDLGTHHLEEYSVDDTLKFQLDGPGGLFVIPAGFGINAAIPFLDILGETTADIYIPQHCHLPNALRAPPLRL